MSMVAGPPPIHRMIRLLFFFFSVGAGRLERLHEAHAGHGQGRQPGHVLEEVPPVRRRRSVPHRQAPRTEVLGRIQRLVTGLDASFRSRWARRRPAVDVRSLQKR